MLWNGRSGHAWVEAQTALDAMFLPFESLLVEPVRARSAQQVLDVGCGTGSTTLAVGRWLGAQGRCTGIDISQPMIAAARTRAERQDASTRFICADAQSYPFDPAMFDMIISRFGVMFFSQPVAAFANLRRAARDGAALHVIAWRSPGENAFMTTAERTAAPLLQLPDRQPGAPRQFAFADRDHVAAILEQSGWTGIDMQPIDVDCTLPESELIGYFTRLGPVGLALQDVNEQRRTHLIKTVRAAFDPYVEGDHVRYTAACWKVSAHA